MGGKLPLGPEPNAEAKRKVDCRHKEDETTTPDEEPDLRPSRKGPNHGSEQKIEHHSTLTGLLMAAMGGKLPLRPLAVGHERDLRTAGYAVLLCAGGDFLLFEPTTTDGFLLCRHSRR